MKLKPDVLDPLTNKLTVPYVRFIDINISSLISNFLNPKILIFFCNVNKKNLRQFMKQVLNCQLTKF
jgi:hypothetical protein